MGKNQPTENQNFRRLKGFILADREWNALWHWELGKLWSSMYRERAYNEPLRLRLKNDDEVKKKAKYISNFLTNARLMHETFERQEVEQWSAKGVTWSHFRALFGAEASDRSRFLAECVKKKWTARQLRTKIKRRTSKGKKSRGGARPNVETVNDALDRLIEENNHWLHWERYCFRFLEENEMATASKSFVVRAMKSLTNVKTYVNKGLTALDQHPDIRGEKSAAGASNVRRKGQASSKTGRPGGSSKHR